MWANQAARIIITVTIIELIVLVSKGLRNCSTTIMLMTVVNTTAAKPPIPINTIINLRTEGFVVDEADGGIRLTAVC